MLHTALTVWRLSLSDCRQFPQATVPYPMLHPPSMQHTPSVPVNIPSLLLETGHWTLPPMKAVPTNTALGSLPTIRWQLLGSLLVISWHGACPLGWLLAVLKRKQTTAWDLILTSCLWPADLSVATAWDLTFTSCIAACRPVGPVRPH
jgi:hypothetical protein